MMDVRKRYSALLFYTMVIALFLFGTLLGNQAIATIVCEGDAIGAVILISNEDGHSFGEFEEKCRSWDSKFFDKRG